jgi:hypothetical protein
VYLSPVCPPPAYPNAQYQTVTASALTGIGFAQNTDYCWKVVAVGDDPACYTEGPTWALSMGCIPPGAPTGPVPGDGATADVVTTTTLDWDDVPGALGYAVYYGETCPPPAYPNAAYTEVSASELTGVSLISGTSYCWKVVALNGTCAQEGPDWGFFTGCTDVVPGAPTVTSTDFAYHTLGTTGSYLLTFSEAVTDVDLGLTWSATTGSGTLGAITPVNDTTYRVAFEGVALGDVYTLHVDSNVTDLCGTPLDPEKDITITISEQGSTCDHAADLDSMTLPAVVAGLFAEDPTTTTSCDTSATNVVWATFTAPADGFHRVAASNATTTNAYSRLALFEGATCPPSGTEVACQTASGTSAETYVSLTQGTEYTLMFFTDGDTYSMVDPEIDISTVSLTTGQDCSVALDLTGETMPYTASGTFPYAFTEGGSCDSSPFHQAWFTYTPATSGWYQVQGTVATGAAVRLAVFETTACSPRGDELACKTGTDTSAAQLYLAQDQDYLILFHTDASTGEMTDPTIDVSLISFEPGETCGPAIDVSSEAFPYQVSGTFGFDTGPGGSCDASPTNMVWFKYTPASTGLFDISLTNATTTSAYSRLAIFQGSDCDTLGAEVQCKTASSKTLATSVVLTQGTDYLLAFYTDGDSYTMVDPTISIALAPPPDPGEQCIDPVDLTGATFPVTLTGDFTDDSGTGGSCDSTPTNIVWYAFTPPTTGSYTIAGNNATTDEAYSRLAVFEGLGCAPQGTQVACETADLTYVSTTVDLTAGSPYLITFFTDGDPYGMENPSITITAN